MRKILVAPSPTLTLSSPRRGRIEGRATPRGVPPRRRFRQNRLGRIRFGWNRCRRSPTPGAPERLWDDMRCDRPPFDTRLRRYSAVRSSSRVGAKRRFFLLIRVGERRIEASSRVGAKRRIEASSRVGAKRRIEASSRVGAKRRIEASSRVGAKRRIEASSRVGAKRRIEASSRVGAKRRIEGRLAAGTHAAFPTETGIRICFRPPRRPSGPDAPFPDAR